MLNHVCIGLAEPYFVNKPIKSSILVCFVSRYGWVGPTIRVNMHINAQESLELLIFQQIQVNMHEYARICTNTGDYAQICLKTTKYRWIRTNMHLYAHIWTIIQEITSNYKELQEFTRISSYLSPKSSYQWLDYIYLHIF